MYYFFLLDATVIWKCGFKGLLYILDAIGRSKTVRVEYIKIANCSLLCSGRNKTSPPSNYWSVLLRRVRFLALRVRITWDRWTYDKLILQSFHVGRLIIGTSFRKAVVGSSGVSHTVSFDCVSFSVLLSVTTFPMSPHLCFSHIYSPALSQWEHYSFLSSNIYMELCIPPRPPVDSGPVEGSDNSPGTECLTSVETGSPVASGSGALIADARTACEEYPPTWCCVRWIYTPPSRPFTFGVNNLSIEVLMFSSFELFVLTTQMRQHWICQSTFSYYSDDFERTRAAAVINTLTVVMGRTKTQHFW